MGFHEKVGLCCPACQGDLRLAMNEEAGKASTPTAGCLSVCGHCRVYLRYAKRQDNDDLWLEILPYEEFEGLPEKDQAMLMQARANLERPPSKYETLLSHGVAALNERVEVLEGEIAKLRARIGDRVD